MSSFHGSACDVASQFRTSSESDWREILTWLDISGMALYLLDQVRTLDIEDSVPRPIRDRLQMNLHQNRQRTANLLRHAGVVANEFQQAQIPFALLKGITLTPDSVPEPALRWQADLDLLVSETHAAAATRAVRNLGYTLHATSGQTVEFRSGPSSMSGLADLYRADTQRSLELHIMRRHCGVADRLTRIQVKSFEGLAMPALFSADIMVQQALHLLKHLCGEHTRASWVLEFWRHIRLRQDDRAFWDDVKAIAATEHQADLALSMSVWLATDLFGAVAHGAVEYWKFDRIPSGIQHWLRRFARELLLSDSCATKLYLLLRRQLPIGSDLKSTARLVFPLHLPARITQPPPSETLANRVTRYRMEASYSWQRLRFHFCEGIRYAIEASCWERTMSKVEQP